MAGNIAILVSCVVIAIMTTWLLYLERGWWSIATDSMGITMAIVGFGLSTYGLVRTIRYAIRRR
ncbi:MAG: hypothetical protein C4542_09760 [Dehalococcoidia bacterium]|nr:MAG: hypothetical protein C4542_09760 [Dehalococcoidia bacterium]